MTPFNNDTLKVIGIGVVIFGLLFILPMPESKLASIFLRSTIIFVLFVTAIYKSNASYDFNSLVDKYSRVVRSYLQLIKE
jgi:hypothetical protein